MSIHAAALQMLSKEARALLARLARMEPFVLHTPMVPAAAIPLPAQIAIERHLEADVAAHCVAACGLDLIDYFLGRRAILALAMRVAAKIVDDDFGPALGEIERVGAAEAAA